MSTTHPVVHDLSSARWMLEGRRNPAAPETEAGLEPIAEFEAALPGCVHTALIRAGRIGDPRLAQHELTQQWVGSFDWVWRTSIELTAEVVGHALHELVIDGLDTVACVIVNGVEIASAANVHIEHRIPLRGILRSGINTIELRFVAPLCHIRELEAKLGPRPVNGDWAPFNFMRKAACNFGWDWGPKVATCGIWHSIRLESRSTPRIASVRPLTFRRDDRCWNLAINADIAGECAIPAGTVLRARLTGKVQSSVCCTLDWPTTPTVVAQASAKTHLTMAVESPALWEPLRAGVPALYALTVELVGPDGELFDSWRSNIGFRTISLDTQPDASGRPFTIHVNDKPIFCIGANWIPSTLLPGLEEASPIGAAGMIELLEHCEHACWNMLRVWGGGTYESPAFYDWCDRHGVMVWQDFMFACAMYPEEAPFPALVESEARAAVTRLASHASVVLWCGGNECIWGYENWGWKQRLTSDQSWGAGFYHDLLPRVVAELDPTRPYWANSPWSGSEQLLPNDAANGDRHTWDVKVSDYRTIPSRFCSEFGHQSPSSLETLRAAIGDEALRVWSPQLEHRQRGPGGNAGQYDEVLPLWFAPGESFAEWHYQAQLLQARAMQIAFESCRVNQPWCMGALVWQLNDIWPGLTWSLVDVCGRPKLAMQTSTRAAAVRSIVLSPPRGGGPIAAFALNDTDSNWRTSLTLQRVDADGRVLAAQRIAREVPARSSTPLATMEEAVGVLGDRSRELYLARSDEPLPPAVWIDVNDRAFAFPAPLVEWSEVGPDIRLTARSLIRDLMPLDAALMNQTLPNWPATLLPGDSIVLPRDSWSVTLSAGVAMLDRKQWMCANWFTDVRPS